MEMEHSSQTKIKFTTSSIIDVLQASMIPELNIYNQAQLEIDTPLIKAQTLHAKTTNEIGVALKLDGELKGEIFCLIDTYNKDVSQTEGQFFKTLFIESMNILMGQVLTEMENEHNISCIISHPEFLERDAKIEFSKGRDTTHLNVGYKFISIHNEFDCRILFNIYK